MRERGDRDLARVGLSTRLRHYPRSSLAANRQRGSRWRGLGGHGRVLFADEPTGNLDTATRCAHRASCDV